MSRDQKPGKVRVVGGGGVPLRRRGDRAPDAVAPGSAIVVAESADAVAPGKSALVLPMLFIAGCAIGGGALPLMRGL